jgi:hypothetical protein
VLVDTVAADRAESCSSSLIIARKRSYRYNGVGFAQLDVEAVVTERSASTGQCALADVHRAWLIVVSVADLSVQTGKIAPCLASAWRR